MHTITVSLGDRSYPIIIARDRYRGLARCLRRLKLGSRGIVVTNRTTGRYVGREIVRALAAARMRVSVVEVPDTERAKSPAVAIRLLRRVARLAQRETPTLFAVGGGVVGDLTGFAAGTFRRGVPYVQLPTTLLAQVDSAIGGKVGIDLPEGKNLVGALCQPRLVYSDVTALRTLPSRQLRTGLGEVIKYAAIADPVLWRRLEQRHAAILRGDAAELAWIVERCARIKARVVARDERETRGLRMVLNFGHTAGHALEAATGYSGRLTHGEAIAVGMAVAADLGVRLGVTSSAVRERLCALIDEYGLPTSLRGVSLARVERALMFDKKFVAGAQRWVLLRRPGAATIMRGVPPRLVRAVLRARLRSR